MITHYSLMTCAGSWRIFGSANCLPTSLPSVSVLFVHVRKLAPPPDTAEHVRCNALCQADAMPIARPTFGFGFGRFNPLAASSCLVVVKRRRKCNGDGSTLHTLTLPAHVKEQSTINYQLSTIGGDYPTSAAARHVAVQHNPNRQTRSAPVPGAAASEWAKSLEIFEIGRVHKIYFFIVKNRQRPSKIVKINGLRRMPQNRPRPAGFFCAPDAATACP
jgi:hypothetical protein